MTRLSGFPCPARCARTLTLGGLLSLSLLAPPGWSHEDPDELESWRAAGTAHFTSGLRRNLAVRQGTLVLAQEFPGIYLPAGIFTSEVEPREEGFDAVLVGAVADVPAGAEVRMQIRAVDPDGTKTSWHDVEPESEVSFPRPFHGLQYRVLLSTLDPESTPRFRAFHVRWIRLVPGSLAEAPTPGPRAEVTKPPVRSRAAWGARPPRSGYSRHSVNTLVVHHTTFPTQGQYLGDASIRGIQNHHMNQNGWIDIGYHFVIGPEGRIYAGRPPKVRGAHATPNRGKVGICVVGDYENQDHLTDESRQSLVHLLAWLAKGHSVGVSRIQGHRDFNSTDCPGKRLYRLLPAIRQQVADMLGEGGAPEL